MKHRRGHAPTFLVVEDDDTLRRATLRWLQRVYPTAMIVLTDSAEAAIANLCTTTPFDVILCDYNLRGAQTGGDVLDWVKRHLPRSAARFVFLSGDEACRATGAPWLEKPFVPETMRRTIDTLLADRSVTP